MSWRLELEGETMKKINATQSPCTPSIVHGRETTCNHDNNLFYANFSFFYSFLMPCIYTFFLTTRILTTSFHHPFVHRVCLLSWVTFIVQVHPSVSNGTFCWHCVECVCWNWKKMYDFPFIRRQRRHKR